MRSEMEINSQQIGKKVIKLSQFAHGIIVSLENSKESMGKLLGLLN